MTQQLEKLERMLNERIAFMQKLLDKNLAEQDYSAAGEKKAQIKAYNYTLSIIEVEKNQ